MARDRLELQELFELLIGNTNVYFQPPATVHMNYPCIVYQRDSADTKFASDSVYQYSQRYQVTVISRDPDTDVVLRMTQLPYCIYDRFYTVDNLNHDVFTLYF